MLPFRNRKVYSCQLVIWDRHLIDQQGTNDSNSEFDIKVGILICQYNLLKETRYHNIISHNQQSSI